MLENQLIAKTLRVPAPQGPAGDAVSATRQLDAVLLDVGFTLSRELRAHLEALAPATVIDTAVKVLDSVRRLVGDEVEHNVYFKRFPQGVPDTVSFWLERLALALTVGEHGPAQLLLGGLNLLDLPGYGVYAHSYQEMLAAHEEFVAGPDDRLTVLHLGPGLAEMAEAEFLALAASPTPLSEGDLGLLALLAAYCADGPEPEAIPMRESKAIVNRVRLAHGKALQVDTVTDVLRLAVAVSGGDVTLRTPTRLVSLPRPDRRALLAALDAVVGADPGKLGDVSAYAGPFKRLGERLHPHEHPGYPHAAEVFAVARGEKRVPGFAARVERAFADGDHARVIRTLAGSPGLLVRSVDRIARSAGPEDVQLLAHTLAEGAPRVSGRVLLSLREHLLNRAAPQHSRLFVNREGRAHVDGDLRAPIEEAVRAEIARVLDAEISSRLPSCGHLVVDPEVLDVALPLSGKAIPEGFRVLPRGSRTPAGSAHLRFFIYWREAARTTDYDLSALLLDDEFDYAGQLSYTNLSGYGGVHSGDIISAPDGASEFIDLDLRRVKARYIIPQVNVFSGEPYDEAAEAYFGYMLRDGRQLGRPYEPATVRMRSDLRGTGKVALPLAFERNEDGSWQACWMALNLRGADWGNRVESNGLTARGLAASIVERRYLTMRHLVELMGEKAQRVSAYAPGMDFDGPVTYIGLEVPEGLPTGSETYPLRRLNALVPQ